MFYWMMWVKFGTVRGIEPDGRIICDTEKWYEWRPDMTTADGW